MNCSLSKWYSIEADTPFGKMRVEDLIVNIQELKALGCLSTASILMEYLEKTKNSANDE